MRLLHIAVRKAKMSVRRTAGLWAIVWDSASVAPVVFVGSMVVVGTGVWLTGFVALEMEKPTLEQDMAFLVNPFLGGFSMTLGLMILKSRR